LNQQKDGVVVMYAYFEELNSFASCIVPVVIISKTIISNMVFKYQQLWSCSKQQLNFNNYNIPNIPMIRPTRSKQNALIQAMQICFLVATSILIGTPMMFVCGEKLVKEMTNEQ
jgi:hypothetical protein